MTAKTFSGNLAWFLSIGLLIFLGVSPAATAQSSAASPAPQELFETLKADKNFYLPFFSTPLAGTHERFLSHNGISIYSQSELCCCGLSP